MKVQLFHFERRKLGSLYAGACLTALFFYKPALCEDARIGGADGSCERASIAGSVEDCSGDKGVVYQHYPNGRTIFSIGITQQRILSFISESESHVDPERLVTYLARVRIDSKASSFVTSVSGVCNLTMTADGKTWHFLECAATDERGRPYQLKFKLGSAYEESSGSSPRQETTARERVDNHTVQVVGDRFRRALKTSGVNGVDADVQACYDQAGFRNKQAIRLCMLYDISSHYFENGMKMMFEARGWPDPNSESPFRSAQAFKVRMQIYSTTAFSGSEDAIRTYFGNAPSQVQDIVTK